jgi:penicillin-binding protein 1A
MNSDGQFQGPMTLRQALAHSRNIAAVKLLMDVGAEPAIQMARNLGIRSPLGTNISLSLGSYEVTPLELTAAYTVFPNLGVRVNPAMVKKVVDRFGNVLEDNSVQPLDPGARMAEDAANGDPLATLPIQESVPDETAEPDESEPAPEPQNPATDNKVVAPSAVVQNLLADSFPPTASSESDMIRVLSPRTSYLMLSMMRDVCVSGTAASVSRLRRGDLCGKTGTTDDCTDAWFVGFSRKFTTGVWMGYDAKTSLGHKEYGATAALPVWMDFMKEALHNQPVLGYPVPPGIVFATDVPQRPEALLEAGPDLAPDLALKEISPVDGTFVSDPSQPDFDPNRPLELMQASTAYAPELIRILSTTGQTLGYGAYTRDQRGKIAVHARYPVAGGETLEQSEAQGAQEESYMQGAARFLKNLPQFIPSLPRGWLQ